MTATTTECACRAWSDISDQEHDWLTTIEQRGFAGAADLVAQMNKRADLDHVPEGQLPWIDLQDFVGHHNWVDPSAVYELAMEITSGVISRRHALA